MLTSLNLKRVPEQDCIVSTFTQISSCSQKCTRAVKTKLTLFTRHAVGERHALRALVTRDMIIHHIRSALRIVAVFASNLACVLCLEHNCSLRRSSARQHSFLTSFTNSEVRQPRERKCMKLSMCRICVVFCGSSFRLRHKYCRIAWTFLIAFRSDVNT